MTTIRTYTDDECDRLIVELLVDADTATWVQARGGKAPRDHYYVAAQPLRSRPHPTHGHYAPTLLRRSWQERVQAWWRLRHPAIQFALALLGLFAAYEAIGHVLLAIDRLLPS